MKQAPYCGPTIMDRSANLTVIWRFLLGECELTHVFACKEKTAVITLEILGVTVQNLVARKKGGPGSVGPCFKGLSFLIQLDCKNKGKDITRSGIVLQTVTAVVVVVVVVVTVGAAVAEVTNAVQ